MYEVLKSLGLSLRQVPNFKIDAFPSCGSVPKFGPPDFYMLYTAIPRTNLVFVWMIMSLCVSDNAFDSRIFFVWIRVPFDWNSKRYLFNPVLLSRISTRVSGQLRISSHDFTSKSFTAWGRLSMTANRGFSGKPMDRFGSTPPNDWDSDMDSLLAK